MTHPIEAAIGKSIDSHEIQDLIVGLGLAPHVTPDEERYLLGGGVRIAYERGRSVETIWIFGPSSIQQEDDGDAGTFVGELPRGLCWGADRQEVSDAFELPPIRGGDGMGDLTLWGPWDGYWLGTHGLHAEFGRQGLRQITLMLNPPGWAPH